MQDLLVSVGHFIDMASDDSSPCKPCKDMSTGMVKIVWEQAKEERFPK